MYSSVSTFVLLAIEGKAKPIIAEPKTYIGDKFQTRKNGDEVPNQKAKLMTGEMFEGGFSDMCGKTKTIYDTLENS